MSIATRLSGLCMTFTGFNCIEVGLGPFTERSHRSGDPMLDTVFVDETDAESKQDSPAECEDFNTNGVSFKCGTRTNTARLGVSSTRLRRRRRRRSSLATNGTRPDICRSAAEHVTTALTSLISAPLQPLLAVYCARYKYRFDLI